MSHRIVSEAIAQWIDTISCPEHREGVLSIYNYHDLICGKINEFIMTSVQSDVIIRLRSFDNHVAQIQIVKASIVFLYKYTRIVNIRDINEYLILSVLLSNLPYIFKSLNYTLKQEVVNDCEYSSIDIHNVCFTKLELKMIENNKAILNQAPKPVNVLIEN